MFGTWCQGFSHSAANVFHCIICEEHVSVLKNTFLKWKKHSPFFVNVLWERVATYLFYGSAINVSKYNKSELQNFIDQDHLPAV